MISKFKSKTCVPSIGAGACFPPRTKLITSSGTRSIIHRETETTGSMLNTVVDILERARLIRAEQRSGVT